MEILFTVLICAPFAMALIMALCSNDKARAALTYLFGAVICVLSIVVAVLWFMNGSSPMEFDLPATGVFDKIILIGDIVLMFVIIWLSVINHKAIISLLSIVQTCLVAALELWGPEVIESHHIKLDALSIIMVLIIGVVGVGIGIYAVGYMRGYHVHHKEVKDRRPFFFAIMFMFYGAMFGLVGSMNLIWLFFFWEVTSVSSFLLIGYTKTKEATNNSFRALWMNLLGGMGIAIAIAYAILNLNTTNLYDVISKGQAGVLIPIAFLAFAALTKSAQFPFSGWLLGAMVAPTPSSALLHSATMVKAGVYLLLRLSPALCGKMNYAGMMVYIVGGFTFFMASVLAISQHDGKKVLAYSTISNLGLIVACAGIGTKETVWAGIFLVIFHAVSKSMLFQCVGAIENTTGSRDVEDMEGLSQRYPKLALILMIGIASMFLAPFGMLASKWGAMTSFITGPSIILVLFICFGSATTMFYWTKWFAKLLGISHKKGEDVTQKNEYVSMFVHAFLILALCLSIAFISNKLVVPFVSSMFGSNPIGIGKENIIIMIILVEAIIVIPLICYFISKKIKSKKVLAYMGGANAGDNKNFIDSMGEEKELKVSNWYLDDLCGEKRWFKPAIAVGTTAILFFLIMVIGGAM